MLLLEALLSKPFAFVVIATATAINCYHGVGANGLASITSQSCGNGISLCATTTSGEDFIGFVFLEWYGGIFCGVPLIK